MPKRRVPPGICDFPRRCGPSSTRIGPDPKLKYFGSLPSNEGYEPLENNAVLTKNVETKRMISFRKRLSSYRDFLSLSRPSINKNQEKKRNNRLDTLLSQGDHVAPERVRATLRSLNTTCRNYAKKRVPRVLQKATKDLQVKAKLVNPGKQIIGSVPRVEVGDEFLYWREFNVVGLHRQITRGIDYVNVNGMLLATSVVSGGVYDDDVEDTNELVYMGEGGNVIKTERKPKDQKLKRGNLALKNSFEVDKYWHEKWLHGKLVYKFKLKRMPDQAEVPWNELKKSQILEGRDGLFVNDISYGKKLIPICAINTVDDEGPPMFVYMTRMVYPNWCNPILYVGCDCVDGCSDSVKCSCVERNRGKIPFNGRKAIVVGRPNCIVYECGPSCKCPPTCQNRVSQHRIQFRFEIFKTKTKGWGVRSLNSIPSRSFICEYTAFAIIPDIGLSSSSQVIEHGNFTIDATHRDQVCGADGNIRKKDCYCGALECSGRMY
ncbi:hypothetical protein SESBI_39254 [Sesbania bispinosa]|nr:hypothetical protein SESBI_39254 [Sesbania bispinosa]